MIITFFSTHLSPSSVPLVEIYLDTWKRSYLPLSPPILLQKKRRTTEKYERCTKIFELYARWRLTLDSKVCILPPPPPSQLGCRKFPSCYRPGFLICCTDFQTGRCICLVLASYICPIIVVGSQSNQYAGCRMESSTENSRSLSLFRSLSLSHSRLNDTQDCWLRAGFLALIAFFRVAVLSIEMAAGLMGEARNVLVRFAASNNLRAPGALMS